MLELSFTKGLGIGQLTLDCLSFPNFSLGVNVWVAIGVFLMNVVPIVVRGLLKRVLGSGHSNLLLQEHHLGSMNQGGRVLELTGSW